MEHKFKQYRFYSENCTQDWKCENCGVITTLPMVMRPTDYHNGYCKEATNAKSKSTNMQRGNSRLSKQR